MTTLANIELTDAAQAFLDAGVQTFEYSTIESFNADLPCFDPFDPGMPCRDKRDIADTYRSPIAWRPLALVQECIAYAQRVGAPNNFDAFPR